MSYDQHRHGKRAAEFIASEGFGRGESKPGPAVFDIKRKRCPMEGCNKTLTAKQLTQYGRCIFCMRKMQESAGGQ